MKNRITKIKIVRDKPDIVETIENQGVPLRKRGKYLWGLCPLPGHIEKTPSFKVDLEKQSFYCFGCHEGGDVIAFIQKYKNLSFKEALKYLDINNKPYRPDLRELRKHTLVKTFRQWCQEYFNDLADLYRCLQKAKKTVKTIEEAETLAVFFHRESSWLYQMEILTSSDDEEKLQLYESFINGFI